MTSDALVFFARLLFTVETPLENELATRVTIVPSDQLKTVSHLVARLLFLVATLVFKELLTLAIDAPNEFRDECRFAASAITIS